MNVLLVGNDHTVNISGVQDERSGAYLNNIDVKVWIKDRSGVNVAGETWPLTLDYVADSNGDYIGNIEDGVELIHGRTYVVEIRAEAPGDLIGFWHYKVMAQWRTPETDAMFA